MTKNRIFFCRLAIATGVGVWITATALRSLNGASSFVRFQQTFTVHTIREIDDEIKAYRTKFRALPPTLSALNLDSPGISRNSKNAAIDEWSNPLVYSKQGSTYQIISYGQDGQPGGMGLDCDLTNTETNSPESIPTFLQLVLHPVCRKMVYTALLSGVLGFCLAFWMVQPQHLNRSSIAGVIAKLVVLISCAGFVALIMTALHVPSGH